jgi:hypothetical protein
MALCLLIKLDERIVLTDSQNGSQVVITPYLRTKSGVPELQFAFDAPSHIYIQRQRNDYHKGKGERMTGTD